MEQKQLDEIDESYFGEEFINEDPLDVALDAAEPKDEVKSTAKKKATKTAKSKKTGAKKMAEKR